MAASLAKLCLAAALAQQALASDPGPLPFMPSVGIAAFQGCVDKTADIHKEEGIEDLHGESCDKLDAGRLEELGVDDCEGTASDISGLIMGFECIFTTAQDETVQEKCFLPKKGKQLKHCKKRMDKVISLFEPEPIEVIEPEAQVPDSFEAVLGVFAACSAAVESERPNLQEEIGREIDDFCREETDPRSMRNMGVSHDDCTTAIAEPLKAFFTVLCSYYVVIQVEDPSAETEDSIDEKVGHFVDHFPEIEEELEASGPGALQGGVRALQQDPLAKRLLRLHSLVDGKTYFGKPLGEVLRRSLRKSASWSPASVALAVAASASALAALGLLAWRRHLAKGQPEDVEPILCAQDTEE